MPLNESLSWRLDRYGSDADPSPDAAQADRSLLPVVLAIVAIEVVRWRQRRRKSRSTRLVPPSRQFMPNGLL